MCSVLIIAGESKDKFALTCKEDGADIWFDATTEIFNLLSGKSAIQKFLMDEGTKISELDILEAIRFVSSIYTAEWSLKDVEEWMGLYHVSFPIISDKTGALYMCDSIQAVFLCLLRFMLSTGYKVQVCKHCGKPYFTKNGRTKYCNRKSPYQGYERYSCGAAVRAIGDLLDKKANSIEERLRRREAAAGWNLDESRALLDFRDRVKYYRATNKKEASISNLLAYKTFLDSGEGLPRKYQRIKVVV